MCLDQLANKHEYGAAEKVADKSLIVIAVEVEGKKVGRIRLRSGPDASAASLHLFIGDSIEPGSTVHTDGWQGFKGLEQKGYPCKTSVIGKQRKDAFKLLPHVHCRSNRYTATEFAPPG